MPKHPINYDETIYYKIYCKDKNVKDVYVGYTTQFTKRKSQHKRECTIEGNKKYNNPLYIFIRDHGGWSNFIMVSYRVKKLKNKLDADAKLRYYIDKLGSSFN